MTAALPSKPASQGTGHISTSPTRSGANGSLQPRGHSGQTSDKPAGIVLDRPGVSADPILQLTLAGRRSGRSGRSRPPSLTTSVSASVSGSAPQHWSAGGATADPAHTNEVIPTIDSRTRDPVQSGSGGSNSNPSSRVETGADASVGSVVATTPVGVALSGALEGNGRVSDVAQAPPTTVVPHATSVADPSVSSTPANGGMAAVAPPTSNQGADFGTSSVTAGALPTNTAGAPTVPDIASSPLVMSPVVPSAEVVPRHSDAAVTSGVVGDVNADAGTVMVTRNTGLPDDGEPLRDSTVVNPALVADDVTGGVLPAGNDISGGSTGGGSPGVGASAAAVSASVTSGDAGAAVNGADVGSGAVMAVTANVATSVPPSDVEMVPSAAQLGLPPASSGVVAVPPPPREITVGQMLRDQSVLDLFHTAFTPQFATNEEHTPIGDVTVGDPPIGRSDFSVVLPVEGHAGEVMKYQGNCDALDQVDAVHPLQIDYGFGLLASAAGVAAAPTFLSPGARIDSQLHSRKLQFDLFIANRPTEQRVRAECARRGVVRYMIVERVVSCLGERTRAPVPPAEAVRIGIEVIQLLQRLHAAGVVHGDLHAGNICRRRAAPNPLTLIDFGFASFVAAETDDFRPGAGNLTWVHRSLTPWQLEGHRFVRRDDVYKAVYMVARLIGGPALDQYSHSLIGPALLAWKTRGPLFPWPGGPDPIQFHFGDRSGNEIKGVLNQIHETVMSLVSVHTAIPYDDIITRFQRVVTLMNRA